MGFVDIMRRLVTPSPARLVSVQSDAVPDGEVSFLFKVRYRDGKVTYNEITVSGDATHEVVADLMSYADVQEVTVYKFHGKITSGDNKETVADGLVGPGLFALSLVHK